MIFAARSDSGVFVIDLGAGRASSGWRSVLATAGVPVRSLCTAHGKCAVVDSALRQRVTR